MRAVVAMIGMALAGAVPAVSAVEAAADTVVVELAAGVVSTADASGTSVITATDIAREKPVDLLELLRARVGLDENNSVITMRGVRGIAIVVDGFVSSTAELKSLKPEQVERVEILRGAASARFGAEAMGGAIAVTTRGGGHGLRGNLVQGVDSRLGHYTRIGGGREGDGLGWSLLGEDRVVAGFRTVPDSPFPYQITVADERSRTRTADGRIGWRGRDLEASLNFKRADTGSSFGRPNWEFDWRTDNLRAQLVWRASEALAFEAGLGEERYDSAGVRDRGTGTDAAALAPDQWLTQSSRQREGSLAVVWRDGDRQARGGVNVAEFRDAFGNADYATRQPLATAESLIRRQAAFASAEVPVGAGRLEFGLRRDIQRYLGARVFDAGPSAQVTEGGGVAKSATSPKVALSWPLAGGTRVRASVGTGFSPPQAFQLYNGYVGAGSVTLANPALKPERSTTADVSLSGAGADGDWNVTAFATRWEEKIATRIVDYGTPVVQQAQNVGEVRARGVEAQAAARFDGGWSASANATWTLTRIVRDLADPALVGRELPDMPRRKANASLAWEPDTGFAFRARLRAVGPAFTDEANTVVDVGGHRWRKAGYAVVDLAATWRRPAWELTLALDNAFDRDYVTGFFWRGDPRILRAELTLRY